MLQGTAYDDVVCEQCPYGQYRGAASTGQDCQPWKSCDDTEVLQVEGTATTDRVCEKATVRCPPGLFLNIDTMKCQRCSPGKFQRNSIQIQFLPLLDAQMCGKTATGSGSLYSG